MHEQIIAPYHCDPAWLITASSFLVDRVVPNCERIHLPAREVPGGVLSYGRGPLPAPPSPKRRLSAMRPTRTADSLPLPHENVFDLRRNTPTNWAHFLNNHLPIVFTICTRLNIDPSEALLVLPEQTPDYIRGAARLLGLHLLTTDAPVEGNGVLFDATPWTSIRPLRHTWLDHQMLNDTMAHLDATAPAQAPRRVFLSRRATRAPTNEDEVMEHLQAKGFVKIYPEDLSPAEQFQIFQQTEIMIAVHGAGLAPLLYMQPGTRLQHLIEILHAGHMTDVYRVMAQQVRVPWIGVRGRLKPEYIKDAYNIGTVYKAHSLDNFEVDLTALELALDMVGIA